MQPKNARSTAKAVTRSISALLVVSVAACVPAPPRLAPQAQLPPDPVLAFVSTGHVGQSAVIGDALGGGDMIVIIDTEYNSAAGNVCRTYSTKSAGLQAQHLACGTGSNWQEVAPLVTAGN